MPDLSFVRRADDPEVEEERIKSLVKPCRGSVVMKREDDRAELLKIEKREKAAVKKRDGRCRWPLKHKCRGGLEAAHIRDASLGGEMHRTNLVTLCAWIHRSGPSTIHSKDFQIRCESAAGAEGPLSFWRLNNFVPEHGYYLITRETAPFIYERD